MGRLLALAVLCFAFAARAGEVRRIAVIAGNDRGGEGTRPLLHARDDAKKIYDVLTRLGGVRREDALLVLDQDAGAFWSALAEAERRTGQAAASGERTELIVYFSGHAKDGALRLNGSQLPLQALRAKLAQASADVRIGIFDSCRSGALTRTKGARRAPEFDVQSDASDGASGLVILTSSTSDEDSQESDSLGGSYFTHHLASGLMGDADKSRDGRVTLEEAYAYAYDRTVADTSASSAGAQHPTFSYELAGNGDLVLTDVASRTEGLEFPAAVPDGIYYLVSDEGLVVAEVAKPAGEARRIALAPGRYRVRRRLEDRLRIGEVQVVGGRIAALDESKLRDAPFTDDPVKGASPRDGQTLAAGLSLQAFTSREAREKLFPGSGLVAVESISHGFVLPRVRLAYDVALGTSSGTLRLPALTLPYTFTEFNAGASLLWEPFGTGRVTPFVGARAAAIVMTREFQEGNVRFQSLFTASPGLVFGARMRVAGNWGLLARGRVHYFLYNLDGAYSFAYVELGAMVTYEL
jgi:hypothetical protein